MSTTDPLHPRRRPAFPLLACLLPLVSFSGLLAGACAPSAPPASGPSPESGGGTGDLVRLHEEVRVPGLEDRRFDPESYHAIVERVVDRSEHLSAERVGESAEGRPLREVRFGSGPVPVLLWSQMHGDESTASMALADLFALVAERPEHPVVQTLLEALTVHTIPMLNPDGARRFQRRNAQGIDVNRDARRLATPEGRTLKAVRDRVEPTFAFNLHDQNVRTRVGDTGRGVAIAFLAPAFDETRAVNDVRHRAIELIGALRTAIEPLVEGHIARYDDTFEPRAFGDLMTQWGASTVLIESGGWIEDPQKQYLRKVNFVALVAALEAIATGRYRGVDPERYHSLPRNGRSVGDLLVTGGTVVVPGLPPVKSDLLIRYGRPLLEEEGRIADAGDLGGVEARDTIRVEGRYLHPSEEVLDFEHGTQLEIGAPALFTVSREKDGSDVLWRFEGGPPPPEARPRR